MKRDGTVQQLDLATLPSGTFTLLDPADETVTFWRDIPAAGLPLTDLDFVNGELFNSGLSTGEFASTLRRVPVPSTEAASSTGIEMFHATHGQTETRAPIRAMTVMDLEGVATTPIPLSGVFQAADHDAQFLLMLRRNMDTGAMDLVSFRKGAHFRLSECVSEYSFPDYVYASDQRAEGTRMFQTCSRATKAIRIRCADALRSCLCAAGPCGRQRQLPLPSDAPAACRISAHELRVSISGPHLDLLRSTSPTSIEA